MANEGQEGCHQKVISATRDTRVEANSRQQVQPSCPIDRIDFLRGEKRTNAASFRLGTELEIQLWSLTFLFNFSESAHSFFFFLFLHVIKSLQDEGVCCLKLRSVKHVCAAWALSFIFHFWPFLLRPHRLHQSGRALEAQRSHFKLGVYDCSPYKYSAHRANTL